MRSKIEKFDPTQLKKVEPVEKNPLPDKEQIELEKRHSSPAN